MLTRQQYEQITEYKEAIEACCSNKDAQPYLQKLNFLISGIYGPERNILSELSSSLNELCKRGSDVNRWKQFVLSDYSKLDCYVEK